MTGVTTGQTALPTATDSDDVELYSTGGGTNTLIHALQMLADLFDSVTGHDHSGSGKGKPVGAAGVGANAVVTASITDGAVTSPKLAMTTLAATLGVDTNLAANTNTQLLTITPAAGTWIFWAGLLVNGPTAGTVVAVTIRDETTGGGVYVANGQVTIAAANAYQVVTLCSRAYVVTGTPTISLRAESLVNAGTAYKTDGTYGGAGLATYLFGLRIA